MSLTVVRTVPIAVATVGSGLRSETVLLLGWFTAGPLAAWYAHRLVHQPPHAPERRAVPSMRTRGR